MYSYWNARVEMEYKLKSHQIFCALCFVRSRNLKKTLFFPHYWNLKGQKKKCSVKPPPPLQTKDDGKQNREMKPLIFLPFTATTSPTWCRRTATPGLCGSGWRTSPRGIWPAWTCWTSPGSRTAWGRGGLSLWRPDTSLRFVGRPCATAVFRVVGGVGTRWR